MYKNFFDSCILPTLHLICCTQPDSEKEDLDLATKKIGYFIKGEDSFALEKMQAYFTENSWIINKKSLWLESSQGAKEACTPLTFALHHGNFKMAQWLIEKGAEPSMAEQKYLIQRAIQKEHFKFDSEFIKAELEKAGSFLKVEYIRIGTNHPMTPLDYANYCKNTKAVEVIGQLLERLEKNEIKPKI